MTAVAAAPPDAERRATGRHSWRGAIGAAFIVTLVRPTSWAFGLAGFLAGGGLIVVAWPILVLPTPTGLQNALGGPVSTLVVGTPSETLLLLIATAVLTGIALLLLGTWIGAWAERQGIAVALEAAAEEGLRAPDRDLAGAPGPGRIALIRLLGVVPVAVALLVAWRPLYDAAYRELVLPDDLVTPLPFRVIADVPWPLFAIGATWLISDAAAAAGVRRLLLDRRRVVAAWLLGWTDLIRRPHRMLATALLGVGVVLLLLGPALLASAAGWARVREILLENRDPVGELAAVAIWVAIWLGGLVLAGVATAFRTAAWTFELAER